VTKISSRDIAIQIARLAWEKKAEDICLLDVSKLTQFTDHLVILNGEIDLHLKAIADYIVDSLKKQGIRPHHVEGKSSSKWVLIDYIDVVVHLFLPETRQFYDLENLWLEADRIEIDFELEIKAKIPVKTTKGRKITRTTKPKVQRKKTPARREPEPST
jgi:ribosome-associated protein